LNVNEYYFWRFDVNNAELYPSFVPLSFGEGLGVRTIRFGEAINIFSILAPKPAPC